MDMKLAALKPMQLRWFHWAWHHRAPLHKLPEGPTPTWDRPWPQKSAVRQGPMLLVKVHLQGKAFPTQWPQKWVPPCFSCTQNSRGLFLAHRKVRVAGPWLDAAIRHCNWHFRPCALLRLHQEASWQGKGIGDWFQASSHRNVNGSLLWSTGLQFKMKIDHQPTVESLD